MLTIATHQPSYLAWPPLLEKMARADLFVYLDDVQYTRTSEIHRNRVLAPQGPTWLSIPVGAKVRAPIRDVRLNDPSWRKKHWKVIEHCYGKAPHFTARRRESLGELYSRDWPELLALNLALTDWLRKEIGVTTPLKLSSELGVTSQSSQRILDICLALGATRYLSGPGGLDYMDLGAFEKEGIEVLVQNYRHHPYPQQFRREEFAPRMSAIDMLFNLGDGTREEMLGRGSWRSVAAEAA